MPHIHSLYLGDILLQANFLLWSKNMQNANVNDGKHQCYVVLLDETRTGNILAIGLSLLIILDKSILKSINSIKFVELNKQLFTVEMFHILYLKYWEFVLCRIVSRVYNTQPLELYAE